MKTLHARQWNNIEQSNLELAPLSIPTFDFGYVSIK